MPIRPSERAKYQTDCTAISKRIRFDRAKGRCEWPECGAENYKPHPVTGSKVVLTVAHLNHEPSDCREENLMALCQLHHNRLDMPLRVKHRAETQAKRKAEAMAAMNQMLLFGVK